MPLSDDDKAEVKALIESGLGKFIKSETFTGAIGDGISGAVHSAVEGLKLDEKVSQAVDEATRKDKKPSDKGGEENPEFAAALQALREELDAEKSKNKEEREERLALEATRRQERLESAARDALLAAGVPADRIRHAMAFVKSEGLLAYTGENESAQPGFKGKDKYKQDAVLSMADGVAGWLRTDDGKTYLPPKGARGDGQTNTGAETAPRTEDGKTDWDALGGKVDIGAAFGSVGLG